MKKDQKVRLRFIDAVLQTYGRLSLSMIVNTFGVSRITASRDMLWYRTNEPNCTYDTSLKVFTLDESKPSHVTHLWEGYGGHYSSYLKAVGDVYDVKIGFKAIDTFGVHT